MRISVYGLGYVGSVSAAIGNSDPAFRAVVEDPRPGQRIVDLVHIVDRRSDGNAYDGLCW
ncbi:MAG TPA: hypothetical protein VFS70_14575 [Actinomycetota bacterium]|nr:hypothetical protein [Actinomycetota bacterium]